MWRGGGRPNISVAVNEVSQLRSEMKLGANQYSRSQWDGAGSLPEPHWTIDRAVANKTRRTKLREARVRRTVRTRPVPVMPRVRVSINPA